MKKLLKSLLRKFPLVLNIVNKMKYLTRETTNISPSQQESFKRWFDDNGDKTHRLNYDLNSNSIVFDLGGFKGDWAFEIYSKYACRIYIFEPIPNFYYEIIKRFHNIFNIKVFCFGLSNKSEKILINIEGNASSIMKKGKKTLKVEMKETLSFLDENHIDVINLMKINIEGAEYELLEYMISSGLLSRIENLQVQFHSFVENSENRMANIQNELKKTHYLTYQYPFVWENWRIK